MYEHLQAKLRTVLRIAVLFVYAIVLACSISSELFDLDDIREIDFVRETSSFRQLLWADGFHYFRPGKNLLWFVFSRVEPLGVMWCHIIAIAIGVISFFPVMALCRRVFADEWKALASAAMWLLAPTLVSSVVWLSCVNIQVMVAMASLAIVFHDKIWDNGVFRIHWGAWACIFLFCALGFYECAVAVLPILFLFDILLRPGRANTRKQWCVYACYISVYAAYAVLRSFSGARTSALDSWADGTRCQLAATSSCFFVQHIATWFWPFGRFTVLGYYKWGDYSIQVLLLCAFLVVSILGFAWTVRKTRPILCFAVLFAFVGFAPTSNCLGFGNGPYGDYYLTLASIGIAIGCTEAIWTLANTTGFWRKPALALIAVFVLLRTASIFEAARWAGLWSDFDKACETSIRNFPRSVSNKLAIIYKTCNAGRYEDALRLGREIESQVGPESRKMGNVYLVRAIHAINVLRNGEMAERMLDRCADCRAPDILPGLIDYYRGCISEDIREDEDAAKAFYERALADAWGIGLVPCADRLARLEAIRGNLNRAIDLWERARIVDPRDTSVLWNLSVAYRDAGKETESIRLQKLFLERESMESRKER